MSIHELWRLFGLACVPIVCICIGRSSKDPDLDFVKAGPDVAAHLSQDGFESFLVDDGERSLIERRALKKIQRDYRPRFEIVPMSVSDHERLLMNRDLDAKKFCGHFIRIRGHEVPWMVILSTRELINHKNRQDVAFVLQDYMDTIIKDSPPGKIVGGVIDDGPNKVFFRYHTDDRRLRVMETVRVGPHLNKGVETYKVWAEWLRMVARPGVGGKQIIQSKDGKLAGKEDFQWPPHVMHLPKLSCGC